MSSGATRILTAAGIAAPVLWAGAVVYCGAIRPEYDPVNQFISELAERGSPTETVMRAIGFCLPGLLIVMFGALLFTRSTAFAAAILLIIHGVGRFTAGMFPCDVGCPMTSTSFSQTVHNVAGLVNGLALPGAALCWSLHLRQIGGATRFGSYSLVSAILGLMFLFFMIINASTHHNVGLYQRLSFGLMNLWVAALAVSVWRSRPGTLPSNSGEHVRLS